MAEAWKHSHRVIAKLCVLILLPVGGLAQGMLLSQRVVSAQAHQAIIETVRQTTDAAGQSILVTNRYVELATGLNRKDSRTGQWVRASDTIEPFDRGFVAQNTAHQALWPRTLDGSSVIDVLDAEGQRYRSRVLGLSWFDAVSGKSALIAETRPSTGRLAASNTVLYPDAFTGVKADLAYVNRRDGMAQEVILREALPGPELWDLDPETTRLEVMTEFVEAPAATVKPRVLRRLAEGAARAGWQSPDLVDEEVSFGAYRLGPGRAFDTGERSDLGAGTEVAKRWEEIAGRRVLFEQVEWRRVRDTINRLPHQAKVDRENPRLPRTASLQRHLPARPEASVVQASSLPLPREGDASRSPDFPSAPASLAATDLKFGLDGISPSQALNGPGYVLDYELVTSQVDFTFAGDTTYYVRGTVSLTGTTTLEGAVIKFDFSSDPNIVRALIYVKGPLDCRTARYRPAIFTARDDDTVGAILADSDGVINTGANDYYAYCALYLFNTGTDVALENVRIKHAKFGVGFGYNTANRLRHAQLIDCFYPIWILRAPGTAELQNILIASVKAGGGAIRAYDSTIEGLHLTVHDAPNLFIDLNPNYPATLSLKNSLLVDIDSIQPYTHDPSYPTIETSGSGVFAAVPAGSHYLAEDSPWLWTAPELPQNVGGDLSNELELRSAVPPVVLPGPLTQDTVLYPVQPVDPARLSVGGGDPQPFSGRILHL